MNEESKFKGDEQGWNAALLEYEGVEFVALCFRYDMVAPLEIYEVKQ